jgi:uncharacterized protein
MTYIVYNYTEVSFDWDPRKAESNFRKHDITFEEAQSVFKDEFSRLIADPDHSRDENRYILLGFSDKDRMLVVCHCYREGDAIIRLISARKATKRERRYYEVAL